MRKSWHSGARRHNQACPGTAVPIPDPVPEYGGMRTTSFLKAFGKSVSQTQAGVQVQEVTHEFEGLEG